MGRRAVLAFPLVGLVACAPGPAESSTPPPGPTEPTERPTPGPTEPTERPTPQPTPTSEPPSPKPSPSEPTQEPTAKLPTRDDVETAFANRTPQHWGLEVPGVIQRSDGEQVVVTLDACGGSAGSGYDEVLVTHLRRLSVPATLFLNARWIEANPSVAAELAADPLFELANHGLNHLPLSVTGQEAYGIAGTGSVGEAYDEVLGGAERVAELTGEMPLWFRSGTAHVDEVAVEITAELGMATVNFDVNGDAGATFTPAQVRQAMSATQPGSIIIGHFNRPGSGTAEGMAEALAHLLDQGFTFAQLRDVLAVG